MARTVIIFVVIASTLLHHASLVTVYAEAFDFIFVFIFVFIILLNNEAETTLPLFCTIFSAALLRPNSLIVKLVLLFTLLIALNDALALPLLVLVLALVLGLPFELLRHVFASAGLALVLPSAEVAPISRVNFETE
jgi:hypothetical protein